MQEHTRPQKIIFAEMRSQGVRGLLVYCSDYHSSHHTVISGDRWPDEMRLSDFEPKLAGVRPNYDWDRPGALSKVIHRHQNKARHSGRAAQSRLCAGSTRRLAPTCREG
jgi:hypothetical protein